MQYRLRTLLIVLAIGPMVLAMAYVLSVGPAAMLLQSGITGQCGDVFLHWFYWPLTVMGRQNEAFSEWLDWCTTLWLLP